MTGQQYGRTGQQYGRFWEVDFARGIAIIMMILFHFLYDMSFFGRSMVDLDAPFWFFFPRIVAGAFILLAGVSMTLSYSREKKKNPAGVNYGKYVRRGLTIFSWGLLITLMTWLFLKRGFVVFGVLHLIGLSIILAYPFLKFRVRNLFFALAAMIAGMFLSSYSFAFPWLLWLGFAPAGFYTVDYFPLLPWFGVMLFGVFLGNTLYPNYIRRIAVSDLSEYSSIKSFCFLGRHSLLIYLLHQPVLIAFLYAFGFIDIGSLNFF